MFYATRNPHRHLILMVTMLMMMIMMMIIMIIIIIIIIIIMIMIIITIIIIITGHWSWATRGSPSPKASQWSTSTGRGPSRFHSAISKAPVSLPGTIPTSYPAGICPSVPHRSIHPPHQDKSGRKASPHTHTHPGVEVPGDHWMKGLVNGHTSSTSLVSAIARERRSLQSADLQPPGGQEAIPIIGTPIRSMALGTGAAIGVQLLYAAPCHIGPARCGG
jgi:hypothetical protein